MAKSKTKSVSVKKSLKTNKKKKFSLKNLDFKKNWKKLSYLGLSGFLVVASFGYGAWGLYQQDKASAAGLLAKTGGLCKTMTNYRGTFYYATAPVAGKMMSVLALSGSSWVTVASWAQNVPSGAVYYYADKAAIKSYGKGGYVTIKAVFTPITGAPVSDSCYAAV
jgi:hypothetical protein